MIKIRTLDDLSPLEQLSLTTLSYSRLDTYNMCPAKFFYTYVQRADRVFAPHAALGSAIHQVLEQTPQVDLNAYLETYQDALNHYDPDQRIPVDLLDAGQIMLEEFADRHQDEDFDVIAVEKPFEIVIGTYHLRGYIDRVDRLPGNRIRVIDWKTGKYEQPKKTICDNLQLGIYALAIHHEFPEHKIQADLYYLRSGHVIGCEYNDRNLEKVYRKVVDQANSVINDLNFPFTNNKRICTFCDHAKTGVCKVGAKRLRDYEQRGNRALY